MPYLLLVSQPLKDGGFRVIYLVDSVRSQLASEDMPWVPMDPQMFMIAPRSMMDVEYDLWGSNVPFTNQAMNELDYNKFNGSCLMPSLIIPVCVLVPLIFL